MRRSGFTLMELMVVLCIAGLIMTLAFPKIRVALDKNNVSSARVAIGTSVAIARVAAIQRGCSAVVHFPSSGMVWVTACPRLTPTGTGTVDTLNGVDSLAGRYSVTLSPSRDSIRFDPRGLSMDNATTTVTIMGKSTSIKDSVVVNPIGRVTH